MSTKLSTNGLFFSLEFISFHYSGNIIQLPHYQKIMSEGQKATEVMGRLYKVKKTEWVMSERSKHLAFIICHFPV